MGLQTSTVPVKSAHVDMRTYMPNRGIIHGDHNVGTDIAASAEERC